ncbi:MAG TPA: chemotaxis response regulator protein-glutamate methylesterase [Rhodopila sp.]|uniref:chemotaxis response regulator protein-glutamate methylesterase n=1 Tax=Rhodopila sp. TaxID=2480087 RepID=UPI002C22ADEC|nr:chemotaxis response regulator protein-glutamate methylesterase [Rhodopila sp.]HVY13850.1 chemotaxis response regulator protein-glutamate methylesterase [Rhodopila sp.]
MKIGIVNDMPIAVEALRRVLALESAYEVVWVARNGQEAVQACACRLPDLVLMDLIMPVMDGVEATRQIMMRTPCPILIVTSGVGANAWRTFEAMGHGALDAVDTPNLTGPDKQQNGSALLAKIETIGRLIGEPASLRGKKPDPRQNAGGGDMLLGIGASAGGPAALATILSALAPDFPGAVVIVQHVDEQFAPGMAEWLNQTSRIPVRIAREGDRPTRGVALMAGTNNHLRLNSLGRLGYTPEPVSYVYRPSVDVLFQSIARYWTGHAVGVLLTGMGRDGAAGLKAMRNKGFYTIAQDDKSSAVYGMPKAAAAIGAATEILGLDQIAVRLTDLFNRAKEQ